MLDLDTWRELFSTLGKHRLRTALTGWGVFWGAFMLVSMLGIGRGLERGVATRLDLSTSFHVFSWRTTLPHAGLAPGRRVRLDTDDVTALRALPDIIAIAPGVELGRGDNRVAFGNASGSFRLKGETDELAIVAGTDNRGFNRTYVGRFFNARDSAERRKVAVIGEGVRRILFDAGIDPIGQYISVRGVQMQVIGVFNTPRPGFLGERMNMTVVVPLSTFQVAYEAGKRAGRIDSMGLSIVPGTDVVRLQNDVEAILRARHRVHPNDKSAIRVNNSAREFERVQSLFQGIRAFVWLVCIATLLAGALGVSNVMLISVKERTREFGVRKALGATPGSIVRLVLREASVLTALSGYLGLVAGVSVLELVARLESSGTGPLGAPSIDLGATLVASGVLALSGIIAGVVPARHAARIQPVVALRAE